MYLKSYSTVLVTFIGFLVAFNSTEQNQFDDIPGPCIIRRTRLPRLEPVKVQNIFSFYNTDISHVEIKKNIFN